MYRVRTYEEAQATLDALPIEILAGYVEVLDVLELTPWNGAPLNEANPDGAVRQLVFGSEGQGDCDVSGSGGSAAGGRAAGAVGRLSPCSVLKFSQAC